MKFLDLDLNKQSDSNKSSYSNTNRSQVSNRESARMLAAFDNVIDTTQSVVIKR